jgi:UDP-N-acetylmuramoyl-tripeptide--D-alanyl-D-alanine ligase
MEFRRHLRKASLALWHVKVALMYAAAFGWRRLLFRTTFIAVTGSVGKTTAKECMAAIFASQGPTLATFANQNDYSGVPRTLLRVRPRHRFAVIEVAGTGFGLMRRSARLVRPDVAVVLVVARTHMKEFRTLDHTAGEKARLLAALRPNGVAVLNGDDPRVAAMGSSTKQRVVRFGTSQAFDYWAECISSKWPDCLSFRLHTGLLNISEESHWVQSQLVGTHWRHSLLGSLAAAHVCGVPLADAIQAVARVRPTTARMQPAVLPCGAVVIRDEFNGSIDTLEQALTFLEEASAQRKILVWSGVTDTPSRPRDRITKLAKRVSRINGRIVFVGVDAHRDLPVALAAGIPPENVHGFGELHQAAEFLRMELGHGDLVLLRGRLTDHISRLYFGLIGSVECRKSRCDKKILCDMCPELGAIPDASAPEPGSIESRNVNRLA